MLQHIWLPLYINNAYESLPYRTYIYHIYKFIYKYSTYKKGLVILGVGYKYKNILYIPIYKCVCVCVSVWVINVYL